jgi:hypothetical protein
MSILLVGTSLARAVLGGIGRKPRAVYAVSPTGQVTPVPPSPQYPFGFFCRYCWWYGSA